MDIKIKRAINAIFSAYGKASTKEIVLLDILKSKGLPDSYGIEKSDTGSFYFYDEEEVYDMAPSNWSLEEILEDHLVEQSRINEANQ